MFVWIPEKFPSLNEYINAERRHRMIAAKMKKTWTETVMKWFIIVKLQSNYRPIENYPVGVRFIIHEKDKRRDIDNVSAMVSKFCLDGMVKAGVIPDDSQKYINKIECDLVVDGKVGVEIYIDERSSNKLL